VKLTQENTNRTKKKPKNVEESNPSNDDERTSQDPFHHADAKEPFLACLLPNGSQRKVRFVVGEDRRRDKHEEHEKDPSPAPKVPDRNKKPTNLLNLFFTAIEKADDAANDPGSKGAPEPVEPLKPATRQKRLPRGESEDFIKRVRMEARCMKIFHSQLQESKYRWMT
jgi:hypothetical protein